MKIKLIDLVEIAPVQSVKSDLDLILSKVLKDLFKSHRAYVGKSKEQMQEWVDEHLSVPVALDLKTKSLDTYNSSMRPHTIKLTSEMGSVKNFILAMKMTGLENKYRYVLISPDLIIDYLFGDNNNINIPEWEV